METIGQVSKKYGISMRMLRYYEQAGLIRSIRNEGNAYRFYDEEALKQLRFIILLRKLRISVKQIHDMLNDQNALASVEIFERNINEIDEEIASLSLIKSILARFAEELRSKAGMVFQVDLLDDAALLSVVDSLSFSKNHITNVKENLSMEELNKANEKLNKLTDRDVRIVYLPPSYVASFQCIECDPEKHVWQVIDKFARESKLSEIKPDLRHYGFNAPDPVGESNSHGYEMWVTIPEDMEVPAPLTKKYFQGGMYAAHMINIGDFHEWEWMFQWIGSSEKYEYRNDTSKGGENMNGLLEECLNYYGHINSSADPYSETQLDLLMPVKKKI